MTYGRPRRLRWWHRIFDKEVRHATKRMKELKAGDLKMVTVDYTDGGIAITIPEAIRHEWDNMPYDAQQEFLRHVDAQAQEGFEDTMYDAHVEGHRG